MLILVTLAAIGCYFLAQRFRRDPNRFRREWKNATRDLRGLPPRPVALIATAVVLVLLVAGARAVGVWIPFAILIGLALLVLGLAWLREFHFLIQLTDDVFPGRNDKLIWGILLIVLPPVGVWLFRNYRAAHWPQAKPARPSVWDEFF